MELYETLLWQQDDAVVTITLNRPAKKNAMSWRMFEEIRHAFERAGDDDDVRCVVVTGAGGAFCSGADLTDPENMVTGAAQAADRMRKVGAVAQAVATCVKPTIAKVTGIAAGAGCNLALLCDLVVASRSAAFAELFVKRGLVVDFGGTWALTRLLPLHRAKEMALLGDTVTADEAAAIGLINRMCDDEDIDDVVDGFAKRLTALPPRAIEFTKDALNKAAERTLHECLDAEGAAQSVCLTTEDMREAVTAWVEKREPRFTGR